MKYYICSNKILNSGTVMQDRTTLKRNIYYTYDANIYKNYYITFCKFKKKAQVMPNVQNVVI